MLLMIVEMKSLNVFRDRSGDRITVNQSVCDIAHVVRNDIIGTTGRHFLRKGMTIFTVIAFCVASAAGCAKSPTQAEQSDFGGGLKACTEPRPDACTMQYDPVCGEMADGRPKTYSNACSACSDRLVNGYTSNACSSEDPSKANH